jgi:hypothetical protein
MLLLSPECSFLALRSMARASERKDACPAARRRILLVSAPALTKRGVDVSHLLAIKNDRL